MHDLSRHDSDSRIVKNKVKLTRKPRIGDNKKLNTIANIRKKINESIKRSSSAHKLPSVDSIDEDESGNVESKKKKCSKKMSGSKGRDSPGYDDARAFADEISMSSSMPARKSNRLVTTLLSFFLIIYNPPD